MMSSSSPTTPQLEFGVLALAHHHPRTLYPMASSPLQAFDPLAKHYFTSHGTPAPPTHQPVAFASRVPFAAAHPPPASSVPSHQTPRPPVKAPQPLHPGAAAAAAKPIFTSFQKDRASPDLPDVKKKSPASWGASPASSPTRKQ